MTYEEIMQAAREATEGKCSVCRECDGRVCADRIPGPGSIGDVAARNFSTWREIRLNMDTLTDVKSVDTSVRLFGRTFSLPVFAGPVGAVTLHYGKKYDDAHYNDILVRSCAESGICAFTGDGVDPEVMRSACSAIAECGGCAVPTVKPWDSETVAEKTALVENSGAFAVAMDVDAAGLPFLRGKTPPAGTKTEDELRKIIDNCKNPFIVKGIMTVRGAEKAIRAGRRRSSFQITEDVFLRNARQRQRCCRKSRKRSRDAQRFSLTEAYVQERTYSRRSPSARTAFSLPARSSRRFTAEGTKA